jgi:hypothetical protein
MNALWLYLAVFAAGDTWLQSKQSNAEDSTGSIFDYISSDYTPEEEDTRTENVSQQQATESQSVGSLTVYKTHDVENQAYELSYTNELANEAESLREENYDLRQENEELEAEQEELQRQLEDAEAKEKYYYEEKEESLSGYRSDIKDEQTQSKTIQKELKQTQAEDAVVEEDSDDNDYVMQASDAMVYVVALLTAAVLCVSLFGWIENLVIDALKPAFKKLVATSALLGTVAATVTLFMTSDFFYYEALYINHIAAGVGLFYVFWAVMGLYLLYAAQKLSSRWSHFESMCHDFTKLEEEAAKTPDLSYAVEYGIMRQEFLTPSQTVALTEAFLRPDFDFAEYLSVSLGSVLSKLFSLSWLGLLVMILAVVFWRLMFLGERVGLYLMFVLMPFILAGLLAVLFYNLRHIYHELVPFPKKQLSLPKSIYDRSFRPVMLEEPEFLAGRLPADAVVMGTHPAKLTCAFIFTQHFPSRHELLFTFDRFGPSFMLAMLQGLCITMTLWLTILILFYGPALEDEVGGWGVLFILLEFLIWAAIVTVLVPATLRYLTLSSKVQQLKDRPAVREVALKTKRKQAELTQKIFRQFKMIYREKSRRELQELPSNDLRRQVQEVFALVSTHDKVHISQIDELLSLCGMTLEEDELRLFAKECEPDDRHFIDYSSFEGAVQRLVESVREEPLKVLSRILGPYSEEKCVKLKEIRRFFADQSWHFMPEDMEKFMVEVKYLAKDGTVSLESLASRIKDDLESFPR